MTFKVTLERAVHPETGRAQMPQYETAGAAGVDLRSAARGYILPGEVGKVPTGIKVALPQGLEAQVRPRSGLAAKWGVTVLNSPGTIDSDYRGEIIVLLINHGGHVFRYEVGDRIAQLVFAPVSQVIFEDGEVLADTGRGAGGFGSTGVN